MHDLINEYTYCKILLDELGIEYQDFSIHVNTRAKRRWGQCRYSRKEINISNDLLDDGVPLKSLQQTILHELLHTVDGCQNHKAKWQSLARQVNDRYGYRIKSTNSADDLGIPLAVREQRYKEPTYRYTFVCDGCGATIRRQRESRFTRHPEWYRCKKCHGHFHHEGSRELEGLRDVANLVFKEDKHGQLCLF